MTHYIEMAQGSVLHLPKPNSFVKKQGWNDKSFTLCGRNYNPSRWFESGIGYFNTDQHSLPDYAIICKVCTRIAERQTKDET